MAKLNAISCGPAGGANTGVGDCPYQLKPIIGAFLGPKGFKIPQATLEDPIALQEFLTNATMAPPSQRIYPIHGFVGMPADNSEADQTTTFGYGRVLRLLEGNYAPQFQHYDGGVCLQKNLRKFNSSRNLAFFWYDSSFTLIGQRTKDAAGVSYLEMIPLIEFYAEKIGLPTSGTEAARYLLDFTFAPKYLNDNIGFIETTDFDIQSITGLQDVVLNATLAGTDVNVSAVTSCGGVDLFDLYQEELSEVSAWSLLNGATGAPITITDVTANEGTKTWTLGTASALPASVIVNLAAPTVLAAPPIDMPGYEGLPTTVSTATT